MTLEAALQRYLREVTPTKRPSTQAAEHQKARPLIDQLGKYSLAALSPDIIAQYRDRRLAGDAGDAGKLVPRSNNAVRMELALLSHLFTIAIKEWGMGLPVNPVGNIHRPAPSAGRNRRLTSAETQRLRHAVASSSNPMLGRIVQIAQETGMRLSEIMSMKLGQVDLTKRVILTCSPWLVRNRCRVRSQMTFLTFPPNLDSSKLEGGCSMSSVIARTVSYPSGEPSHAEARLARCLKTSARLSFHS